MSLLLLLGTGANTIFHPGCYDLTLGRLTRYDLLLSWATCYRATVLEC